MSVITTARIDILSQAELEQLAQQTLQESVFRGIGQDEWEQLQRDGQDSFLFHRKTYYHNKLSFEPIFRAQYKKTGIITMHELTSEDIQRRRFQFTHYDVKCWKDNRLHRKTIWDNVFYQCQETFTGKVYVCRINGYR